MCNRFVVSVKWGGEQTMEDGCDGGIMFRVEVIAKFGPWGFASMAILFFCYCAGSKPRNEKGEQHHDD